MPRSPRVPHGTNLCIEVSPLVKRRRAEGSLHVSESSLHRAESPLHVQRIRPYRAEGPLFSPKCSNTQTTRVGGFLAI